MNKPPKFILSRKKVLSQLKKIEKISDFVSYSFKTNPEVGKVLEKESECLFSLSSSGYIKSIRDKERIIFFAVAWDADEIKKLLKLKIRKFVVDNSADLKTLLDAIKGRNEKIWVFLRMKLKENTIYTGKHFVFGMGADEINSAVEKIRGIKNIEKIGIHVHRKTQNISEWSLKDEISDSLDEKTLKSIYTLNIGGGLPSEYRNSNPNEESILKKINELREWLNKKGIMLIVEPGRFIAAPSIKLVAHIKSIFERNIVLDCSVYNSCMDTFVMNIRLLIDGETDEEHGKAYVVKGCTPDSIDIFRYKVFLKNPKIGDEIVFLNAGAYNFASDFDGLKKIPTEIIG
ncbi:MAG: decarboxylase [Candidatus Woesearchaeota archaeon]|nr:decarboxylase [Candidatus Woesearchaeota archaeon]